MFSSFIKPVSRTNTASQDTLLMDGGLGSITFHSTETNPKYIMSLTLPPLKSVKRSSICPPYHYHRKYTETFDVTKGQMLAVVDGVHKVTPAGQSITIPAYDNHEFSNASEDEELKVSVVFNGSDEMKEEERFFRSVYGHIEDCNREDKRLGRASSSISVIQLCAMINPTDTYLALPGPKFISQPLGSSLTWFLGVVVGEWLLGYRYTYPEYWKEAAQ